MHKTASVARA